MRFPFKVDTHLRTKLLMLTVIAIVVFLFIVEWVRVDVVAIAMMVLLPELGLLDARDTFRGLSSNARHRHHRRHDHQLWLESGWAGQTESCNRC